MKAKRSGSSARARRVRESVKRIGAGKRPVPDRAIDFSDIPELSEEQLRSMRRLGRPPVGGTTKIPIAFRVHPKLLARIRQMAAERGVPYQTFMHELLEKATSET